MKHRLTFDTEIKALVAGSKLNTLGSQHGQSGNHIAIQTEEPLSQDDQAFLVEALVPTSQRFNIAEV